MKEIKSISIQSGGKIPDSAEESISIVPIDLLRREVLDKIKDINPDTKQVYIWHVWNDIHVYVQRRDKLFAVITITF